MSLLVNFIARFRRLYFKKISGNHRQMEGKPILMQPLMIKGDGKVFIGDKVQLGYELSPGFWSGYVYFDLRGEAALIKIGDGVILNNNTTLTADGASIQIGKNTISGVNLSIMTSDGHTLSPGMRMNGQYPRLSVLVGENVFIGDNVMILKGVKIGKNSVIGAGSLVSSDIPDNVLAAGNPCRVIRPLR